MTRIFVYDALRRGKSHHGVLGRGAALVARTAIVGYRRCAHPHGMIVAANIKPTGRPVDSIAGEVYDVSEEVFHRVKIFQERLGYTALPVATVSCGHAVTFIAHAEDAQNATPVAGIHFGL